MPEAVSVAFIDESVFEIVEAIRSKFADIARGKADPKYEKWLDYVE